MTGASPRLGPGNKGPDALVKFLSGVKSVRFFNLQVEGKCQSRKFDLYFYSEYWSPKPAKTISRTSTLQLNKEKRPVA